MSVVTSQQLAEKLLTETRDEIRRADTKATDCLQIIGGGGFTLLITLPGNTSDDWRWWAAGTAWTLAMLCLAAAVTPRLHNAGPAERVTYFGHVARLRRPARVQRCIEEAAADTLPGVIAQLCASSRIALVKFQLIRIAIVLTAGSVALIATSLFR
ncbi:Pycsar system effector family protein [Actinoplanes sp. NBRC 101535]|uniref:Pycsar system effector family protein n=1 Tax=Actinoplanes sp. NBRC 101535 TaxID=3032196 RepID=UPI0024A12050|nr:Pycsar system effector family protein [Actinoplanes sp. NBRC 101535]GLY05518.1 hypothetical protein Acsp01_58970 [Actinoplanes sp. NBRC 101535]